ncbi:MULTISPECIES: ABC transporter permease [unclassified Streptomyces]|uniref:ABC transporter permease n=1 Tax=unclassified Streptomyces TaxID=2593676 RepID=UPI002DDA721E|nr:MULTISPECIES: ABC transporter permease [unclassified Streptomyces]WSA93445.1 ABC transporter permease [Streptomyces sp. NBC_01795]WSB77814.1 ABC transporter permease [Streptomyces sp. NBC_01775]WSS13938.1 ABC transporter permease [Streptomyces sp. NBC_01186]WSS42751.1 ABC transporter permease [Streptomyces sp. NBC_01187]
MSAVTGTPGRAQAKGARTSGLSGRRLGALARAEMTLLLRNRSALFVALVVPIMLTFSIKSTVEQADLSGTGLSMGTTVVPGSVAMVLVFAIYSNLVGVYVARREELVLKRLRTGEANDLEILGAAALPAVTVGLAQCVLLLAGGAAVLDVGAPARPDLIVAGVVLGIVMMASLAAASTVFTRSAEMAQLTPMPLMMLTFIGSGVFVPLEVLPDQLAEAFRWLPMTPVMDLVRGGWTEQLSGAGTLRALAVAVAWIALGAYTVRRRFRWEPRR